MHLILNGLFMDMYPNVEKPLKNVAHLEGKLYQNNFQKQDFFFMGFKNPALFFSATLRSAGEKGVTFESREKLCF